MSWLAGLGTRHDKTHDKVDPDEYEAGRSGHFEDHRFAMIDDLLAPDTREVLEFGSGTGSMVARLAEAHPQVTFHGVDIDERLLDFARQRHDRANTSWSSELPDGPLDLAYGIDVIHHVHDRVPFFAGLAERVRPGGCMLLIEPNIWHPVITLSQQRMRWAGLDEDHFRPWQVEPELEAVGFTIQERTYAHLWPAAVRRPPTWAKRAESTLERRLGGSVTYRLRRR